MRLIILMCLLLVGAAPATAPTTKPIDQIEAACASSSAKYQAAVDAAGKRFEATDSTIALTKAINQAEAKLKLARSSGTPQERLDASSAFNKLRLQLEHNRTAAIEADMEVKSAAAERLTATRAFDNAMAAKRSADAEAELHAQREKADREWNDPINQAIREHRFAMGMTLEQAEQVVSIFFEHSESLSMETADTKTYQWKIYTPNQVGPPSYTFTLWAKFHNGKIVAHGKSE